MIKIAVGVPQQIDINIQQNADVVLWLLFYAGLPIEASWQGAGNVIGLTVTAHGRATNDLVYVENHEQNVNANSGLTPWPITVLTANTYTLNGSVFLTEGYNTGLAGPPRDLTIYHGGGGSIVANHRATAKSTGLVFPCTAATTGTPTDGKVSLLYAASDTLAATKYAGVVDVYGFKSGSNEAFASGAWSLNKNISTVS